MGSSENPVCRSRAVEARDVEAVNALARASGLAVDAAAEVERAQAVFLLLEGEDGLLGFALGWVVADELEILDVAVDEVARGRGHGARLLDELMARAIERGAERAFLEVRASNRAAQRLYERAGFVRLGERRGYYANGEDAWLFGRARLT